MAMPTNPKIYHIVHVDRLQSIVAEGHLWSDAVMADRGGAGTTIGMGGIKDRRLKELTLASHPGLHVGQCVPFYFCPRSVMLYLIYQGNHPELSYHGGQEPIAHLEADLSRTVEWAGSQGLPWPFTLSNAGARYFEDRCDLTRIGDVDWNAVAATKWSGPGVAAAVKDGKQAEFLVESRFPWELVERVGLRSAAIAAQVSQAMAGAKHRPRVEVLPAWYY